MSKGMYAIGVTKDWVEIRQADTPPKLHTTEFNKLVSHNRYVPARITDHQYIEGHYTPVKKMVKFTSSVYMGGKLMATVKSRRFAALTKVRVYVGGMLKLTPEMTAVVMGDKR